MSSGTLEHCPRAVSNAADPPPPAPRACPRGRGDGDLAHQGPARRLDQRPDAPTEKVPETGLTPECRPETSVTYRPSPAWATRSARLPLPGSTIRLGVPTEGGPVGAAAGVARGGAAVLARGARVVEVARDAATLDQRRPAGGGALAVERRAGRAVGMAAVVGQHERRLGHLVALATGKQRPPALDGVGGQLAPMKPANEAATNASSTTGQRRLEGGGRPPAPARGRRPRGRWPRRRARPGRGPGRCPARSSDPGPPPRRPRSRPTPGWMGGGGEPARVGDGRGALAVGVDGVRDLADAGARAAGGPRPAPARPCARCPSRPWPRTPVRRPRWSRSRRAGRRTRRGRPPRPARARARRPPFRPPGSRSVPYE